MEIKLDKNHCIHLHKEEEHKKAMDPCLLRCTYVFSFLVYIIYILGS